MFVVVLTIIIWKRTANCSHSGDEVNEKFTSRTSIQSKGIIGFRFYKHSSYAHLSNDQICSIKRDARNSTTVTNRSLATHHLCDSR